MNSQNRIISLNGEQINKLSNVSKITVDVNKVFKKHILNGNVFPCVAAKATMNTGYYELCTYDSMCGDTTTNLLKDIKNYIENLKSSEYEGVFTTFIASFTGVKFSTEEDFQNSMWSQLQELHNSSPKEWDSNVSDDPENKEFAYSLFGKSFFIVGMHPESSRVSRSFEFPTLVFNSHDGFERLRNEGLYEKFKNIIRKNDLSIQGSINPNLSDFGDKSDALQYSGKDNTKGWKCPFH